MRWSKLCHTVVPFDKRMIRFPVFRSTAFGVDEPGVIVLTLAVIQRTRPLLFASVIMRLEALVSERIGAEEVLLVIGVSRLATHTTVNSEMLLYHIPRYSLAGVELEGLKKPKENVPPSEMMVLPG